MANLTELFGADSSEIFEAKEQADGYLVGTKAALDVHKLILVEHKNRSRAFREALLDALRDQL